MKMPSSHRIYSSQLIEILISISIVFIISSSCVENIFIDSTGKSLHLSITKQSYQPGSNETKTIDIYYSTSFFPGDKIGVIASGGNLTSPVHCGYVFNSNSEWEPLSTPVPNDAGASYLIYYPYNPALAYTDESDIIDNFVIPTDQSDHVKYSKADLMTGNGTIQSGNTLSVQLSHRLSLLEIEYPYEVDIAPTLKVNEEQPIITWNVSSSYLKTYRCIVRPGSNLRLEGTYDFTFTYEWLLSNVNLEPGKYKKIEITAGYAGPMEIHYSSGDVGSVRLKAGGRLPATMNGVISKITLGASGATYDIGRHKSSCPIYLNIHADGSLQFRPADAEGFIPIGSIAEFQMINNNLGGKYKLEADIDLLGPALVWTPGVIVIASPEHSMETARGLRIDIPTAAEADYSEL